MKGIDLLESLQKIDEDLIEEAVSFRSPSILPKKNRIKWFAGFAAAALLVIIPVLTATLLRRSDNPVSYIPPESSEEESSTEASADPDESIAVLPDLLGKNINTSSLFTDSLSPHCEIIWTDSDAPVFTIIDQYPGEGTIITDDTKVTLWVSQGASQVSLAPDSLSGMTLEQANAYLYGLNLYYEGPYYEYSTEVPEGEVIRWESADGQDILHQGDTVKLFISLGAEESD